MLHLFPFIAHAVVTSCHILHCLQQRSRHEAYAMSSDFGIAVGYSLLTIHSLVGA